MALSPESIQKEKDFQDFIAFGQQILKRREQISYREPVGNSGKHLLVCGEANLKAEHYGTRLTNFHVDMCYVQHQKNPSFENFLTDNLLDIGLRLGNLASRTTAGAYTELNKTAEINAEVLLQKILWNKRNSFLLEVK